MDVFKEPEIHLPPVESCTNKDGGSKRDFDHRCPNNVAFAGSISQHWNKNLFRSSCSKQVNLLAFLIKLLARGEAKNKGDEFSE